MAKSKYKEYQVICTDQEPWDQPNENAQIVALGTRAADGSTRRWTVQEVIRAIEKTKKNKKKGKMEGDVFFTVDPEEKKKHKRKVIVQRFKCGKRIVHKIVKSSPSAKSRKDDLNDLDRC